MYQRKAEVLLEFQQMIESAPVAPQDLFGKACSNDKITIESWRAQWISQVKENHSKFGPFKDHSVGRLFNAYQHKPAIVAGAGPSLKQNAKHLKNRNGIPLISCLHNFHYLEDMEAETDFYVTLDAGEVTVEEVYEGGTKTPDEYWSLTKDRTLLAFIGTHPRLLDKWKGQVLFFNCPVPDESYEKEVASLEKFTMPVSTGGNVLGACLYLAKGIMGANPIAFVGADFSFSYEKKFHSWDSKYDSKLGNVLKTTDVFGNKVLTWQSYYNFKCWFDFIAQTVPGIYVNCTEGGIFGAYDQGNIMAVKQMGLEQFLDMYSMSRHVQQNCLDPENAEKKILF